VDVGKASDALELTVADTGVGISTDAPEGVGLANVRGRLASLYGPHGRLLLYANTPHGLIAKLIVPSPMA
jgi:LytS/YehU family sensor histidine kinase